MEHINYSQTINNSHFWSDLNQLLEFLKHQDPDKEFLDIGIQNTIKEGYEIKVLNETKIKTTPYFLHLTTLLYFINNFYNKDVIMEMLQNTINNGINLSIKKNNEKMKRTEVYKKIDKERDYQDLRWDKGMKNNRVEDSEKPLSEWINYIEFHLSKAKEAIYHLKDGDAKAELRKVTALGVRALEIHGCPDRIIPKELKK